jgi:hypothetical protein
MNMFAPKGLYQDSLHSITVIFDVRDYKQAVLMRACKVSFGEKYARDENLKPPYHLSLDLLPGGLREVRR